ncbi:hypothetical protein QYM36_006776 [Artemia franciscana]|uniref:Uncharacterized protein n=1 Tax=Artemia franciscana TaxID=6661 RepID=A0AA88HXS0_ARTSF|nr:hypothetical protein QYM36_006776 [Artemia franciscana]KAK2718099.1 hypothetical protein QYM36_006776 [Artemia franciscana]
MFHVYWPPATVLTLLVVFVIVLILRYGDRWCKARHIAFADTDYVEDVESTTDDTASLKTETFQLKEAEFIEQPKSKEYSV